MDKELMFCLILFVVFSFSIILQKIAISLLAQWRAMRMDTLYNETKVDFAMHVIKAMIIMCIINLNMVINNDVYSRVTLISLKQLHMKIKFRKRKHANINFSNKIFSYSSTR